jgi:hypothetical protein
MVAFFTRSFSTKNRGRAVGASKMSFSRALGLTGAATVIAGSVLSMISSGLLAAPHDSYFVENTVVFIAGSAAAFLVRVRLFRWLMICGLACLGAFAHCIVSLIRGALSHPAPSGTTETIGAIALRDIVQSTISLIQTHMGWPVVLVGSAILVYAAVQGKGTFFTPSKEAGDAVDERASILHELSDAPKWPLVYGAFFILCGILILFVGTEASVLRKLVGALITELGFAFFIAFVIGVSIELRAKVEHDKQISKGLLSYIYGVSLDDDMFISTEEYVFRTPVFRRDLTVSYDFLKMQDDKVLLKYTLSYLVENVSRNPIDYDVHTFVEEPAELCESPPAFQTVEIGLQSITIDGAALKKTEVEKAKSVKEENQDFRESSHSIRMQPGERRRIMTVHLIEKCARDSELWRSLSACAGLTLIINWSEQIPMEVRAAAVHPANKFDSLVRDANSITASLYRPFFPHNGVYFWWSPKVAKPDHSEGAGPISDGRAPPSDPAAGDGGKGDSSASKGRINPVQETNRRRVRSPRRKKSASTNDHL